MGTYRISDVAARTGFTAPTLRYYEQIGLIPQPDRNQSGYRLFTDRHVRILDLIGRAKRLGLPLEQIRTLVGAWEREDCQVMREQLHATVDAKIEEVGHRIAELKQLRDRLEDVNARLPQAPVPGRCGPGCGCEVEVPPLDVANSLDHALVSPSPLPRRPEPVDRPRPRSEG